MANNVNIPAQGTGDTTPKVSTDQVSADSSQVQNFQQVSVSGGVLTRNPTIPVSAASLPLPAGAATEATLALQQVSGGTAIGSLKGQIVDAVSTASAPTYTEGTVNPLSQTNAGALRVGGTVTANIGTSGSLALDATLTGGTAKTKLVDTGGTNVATVSAGGALKVDGSAVTQPVSGTISVSGTMPVSVAVGQEVDGHSANIGALADASSASTLTGLLKNIKAALAGTLATKEVRSATPAQSSVAGSASSVSLLASNANRLGATVFNDSSAILYLKLGATASTTSHTLQMAASSYYEVPFAYTGAIDGIWASATGNARITELS